MIPQYQTDMNRIESGAVIITMVVVILVLTTMIALNMSGSGDFQLLISRNETASTNSFEMAQSGIDFATNTSYLIPDATTCTANVTGCPSPTIVLPNPPFDTANTQVTAASIGTTAIPISSGSSADKYEAVSFNILSQHDSTAAGEGGKDIINQGVVILIISGH
ncbi:MAG: hypothetical protein H7829_07820 [Magnetococcus sp. THC-1_WYH]